MDNMNPASDASPPNRALANYKSGMRENSSVAKPVCPPGR